MTNNLRNKIRNSKLVDSLSETTKKIVLPGFEKVPLFYVLKFFFQGIQKGAITSRASSLEWQPVALESILLDERCNLFMAD